MTAPAGTEGAPAATEGAPAATPPAETDTGNEPLGEPGLKALQEERDARAVAEAKVKEFEKAAEDAARAKLGNEERLTLERDEHKTAAEKATSDLNRLRVAIDKKVPANLADRLVGSTVEELEADADRLLASVAALLPDEQAPAGPGGGRPYEFMPRGGSDPTGDALPTDPAKLAALIPRR